MGLGISSGIAGITMDSEKALNQTREKRLLRCGYIATLSSRASLFFEGRRPLPRTLDHFLRTIFYGSFSVNFEYKIDHNSKIGKLIFLSFQHIAQIRLGLRQGLHILSWEII